jgi:surfeit locus 1 family protein
MSKLVNSEPILIDAVAESSIPGGPIGGQTNISIRNEHVSYIITW